MEDEKKDGGPAFPAPGRVDSEYVAASVYDRGTERDHSGWRTRTYGGGDGMTLRDYFAASAVRWIAGTDAWDDYADMAKSAYAIADAMIAERNKP